jgi:type III restriction enzyme
MPQQVVIEHPVLNSPFAESQRHLRFSDEGITSDIADKRCVSSYCIPIAKRRKRGSYEEGSYEEMILDNGFPAGIRGKVNLVNRTTRKETQ